MTKANNITIKSVQNSDLFQIGPRSGDYLNVAFNGQSIRLQSKIYLYVDNQSLLTFLEDLSTNWSGWTGKKEWTSLESDLRIFCSSDALGHITFDLEISNLAIEPSWTVKASIVINAGDLDSIANTAKELLAN